MTIRVHSYVDGVCTSCGAVKNNDHIGPSWCSGRPTARAEANTLRAEVERLTRERDEARANYAFMVERAANEKLDGYRELGARAAAAENNADKLATQLDEALESLEGLEAHIREHLPYTYDDGEDDDANPDECVEYAAREIRELKATNESLQQAFDKPDGPMARAIARSSYHVEQQARRKAEAERDEAQNEVKKLNMRVSDLKFALGTDSVGWFDRAKANERERDEARVEVTKLRAVADAARSLTSWDWRHLLADENASLDVAADVDLLEDALKALDGGKT